MKHYLLNIHLELHGQIARVHPDTLESRGIARVPEPKLLPSESRQYREQGIVSEGVAAVLQVRQTRAGQRVMESNGAWQYWEQRKAVLGLTRDMSREEKVARILLLRHGGVEHVAVRYRPLVERTRAHTQERQAPTADLPRPFQRLARQLSQEEAPSGGHLGVRLYERERDQGMGW